MSTKSLKLRGKNSRITTNAVAGRQRGAVLIVALVLLVVLTLLGVSTMNSTQLEEKMAANSQLATRAFHAAETGLTEAFNTDAAWDISGVYRETVSTAAETDGGEIKAGQVGITTTFLGFAPPPPGSLYSATSFQSANFDFQSDACTNVVVTDAVSTTDEIVDELVSECSAAEALAVTIHGGAYQIAPKQN